MKLYLTLKEIQAALPCVPGYEWLEYNWSWPRGADPDTVYFYVDDLVADVPNIGWAMWVARVALERSGNAGLLFRLKNDWACGYTIMCREDRPHSWFARRVRRGIRAAIKDITRAWE